MRKFYNLLVAWVFKLALILFVSLLIPCFVFAQKTVAKFNDGSGAYVTKHYHNLFQEYGHTKDKISAKIDAAFQQLFHSDTSKAVYFEAGKNTNGLLAYITDVNHHDVRSEGMSYGMMIAVQLSRLLGWLDHDQVYRVQSLLKRARLPVAIPPEMQPEDFFEKMSMDKKVQAGKIRYILLKNIGEAVITDGFRKEDVTAAIKLCCG